MEKHAWPESGNRLKLMMFDFNWCFLHPTKSDRVNPSSAHDWAFTDPQEYFNWHLEVGNNAIFLMAFTHSGYAFYPTRLGPWAPGPGSELLPRVFELTRQAGLPFYSYFCTSYDVMVNLCHDEWLIPNNRTSIWPYYLAPESPWTDFLCERVEEFLEQFPVDVLFFDWFRYGDHKDPHPIKPAWFVEEPFQRIIGRPMPAAAEEITPEESLRYRREVMAHQFYRLRDTVKRASPNTKIIFTPPYYAPAEPLWLDHPMVLESDGLLAEYAKPETMDWLLSIRQPHQAVIATPLGPGNMPEEEMRKLLGRGCGMNGYVWGTPPALKPHPYFHEHLDVISRVFKETS